MVLGAIVGVFSLWLGLAVVVSEPVPEPWQERGPSPCHVSAQDDEFVTLTIVRHRWHTGFAFAVEDLKKYADAALLPELASFEDISHVEIGWGDRAFYMASGEDYWLGTIAIMWPTSSVMHVVGIRQSIAEEFPYSEQMTIQVRPDAFQRLVTALGASFKRSDMEAAANLGPGLYGDSLFFPARGSFHMFRTCNIWTSQVLAYAGCPVGRHGNFFAASVLEQLAPIASSHRTRPAH